MPMLVPGRFLVRVAHPCPHAADAPRKSGDHLVDLPATARLEPFASLDEQTRMVLGDELLRIWSGTRKTVVFVTHSLNEAVYLADRVVVLSARPGRVVDDIPVDLPRPRTFAMTAGERFGALKDRIWQHIKGAERR